MSSDTILMVAAGMKQNKKPFMDRGVENIYLNYGLLGLGSILYKKGYTSVKMFQGDNKSMQEIFDEILYAQIELQNLKYPVIISVPSFFAVSWALDFIEILKKKNSELKVILGGRWVLDQNLEWCRKKFKKVDFFSTGCPDEVIDKLLYPENWKYYQSTQTTNKPFTEFNYNILNNFKSYQPVIEICRGCGRGCEFCLEKNYPVSKIKSAKEVVFEAKNICNTYGTYDLNFYFQASIFNPTVDWANEFLFFYHSEKMKFNWRFETRVDSVNLEAITILSKCGLKIIDLGLESASIPQIKEMGKSKNPVDYLLKADILLRKLAELGIWSKINILLYVGETKQTIQETITWLDKRKKYIKGVSVNPLILYLNGEKTLDFLNYIKNDFGVYVNETILYDNGYTFIDLSKEIGFEESKRISINISNRYMSKADYFQLKSICYTKRNLA